MNGGENSASLVVEVLRAPVELALRTVSAVVNQIFAMRTRMGRLLKSVQRKIAPRRTRYAPTDDGSREHVDHERQANKACPSGHVRQISQPGTI